MAKPRVKRHFEGATWGKYYDRREKLAEVWKTFTEYEKQVVKANDDMVSRLTQVFGVGEKRYQGGKKWDEVDRDLTVNMVKWLLSNGWMEVGRDDFRETKGYSKVYYARISKAPSGRKIYGSCVAVSSQYYNGEKIIMIETNLKSIYLKTWAKSYGDQDIFDSLRWTFI